MFRKLHIQLTLFSTLITGLVLIAMSCACLYISESGIKTNLYASFLNNASSCISYLESQSLIPHQWLLESQQKYHLHIQLMDNKKPLYFEHLNPSPSAQAAFSRAAEISQDTLGLDLSSPRNLALTQQEEFSFSLNGEDYFACAAVIPKSEGFLSALFLYPQDLIKEQIFTQRLYFAGAALIGILALCLFSWFFTGHMLRPMEKNQKQQVQFIASASHELRSPLTVMLSCLSALRQAKTSEAEHFMDMMEQEGSRMSRLIEDMLSLVNADNHSFSIQLVPVEADTLLLQTYESFWPLARQKKRQLCIELPEEPTPPVYADAARLSQVLAILLDNAMTYVPEGRRIILRLIYENGETIVQVCDNGPGILDEQKEAVFQRFYRADSSRHSREHFGLGLCIAHEIIKLHGGSISVTDTPGGGATFSIRLRTCP
ncbi:MAG: HAMP domain-containing sensor histidine kinase [Eubacteriales bacterium]|nr:HAMP domain-containing sensor histidine kinase [Eubacteriales bacterium]